MGVGELEVWELGVGSWELEVWELIATAYNNR